MREDFFFFASAISLLALQFLKRDKWLFNVVREILHFQLTFSAFGVLHTDAKQNQFHGTLKKEHSSRKVLT